jgi:hypothetical protein
MDNKELYKDNIRDSHWIGEVVDNIDPSNLGRCRIKVFGKFDQLPTDAIPWATPMNRDHVGAQSIPRIGDVVAVRFDNGNIYHPEYWFQVDQNTDLKNEVLDNSSAAQDVVSLVYDAERDIRIWWSPEDGLTMATGGSKDAAPSIRFSNDGKIYLHSEDIFIASKTNDEREPAVKGETLQGFLEKIVDTISNHTHMSGAGPVMPTVKLDLKFLKAKLRKIKQTKNP